MPKRTGTRKRGGKLAIPMPKGGLGGLGSLGSSLAQSATGLASGLASAAGAAGASPEMAMAGAKATLGLTKDNEKEIQAINDKFKLVKMGEDLVDQVKKFANMPLRAAFWFNAMPYIVLAVVIIIIIALIRGPGRGGGSTILAVYKLRQTTKNAYNQTKGAWDRATGRFRDSYARVKSAMAPNYKIQMFFRSISPFQGDMPSVERQRMMSGRCDNLRWIQSTRDGAQGFCHSSFRPNDIIWNMDMSKMPDYFELPQERRMHMNPRMKVRIPYSQHPQDSFYVPECDKATFYNLIDPKTKKEIPAPLFEDTGMKCKLKENPSTLYTPKQRSKDADLTVAFDQ